MHPLDWAVVAGYLLVMLGIGVWAHRQVADTADFFTAGGRMPWWLAGISHHMSGYSAVVFVAYAGVAYEQGIVSYVVFMFPLAIATGIGAFLFAPKWNRLRLHYGIASPLEYLARRFNVTTQQVLAWSGSLLKVFDVAAKWSAIALLLQEFVGVPLVRGIVITAVVTLVYCTAGGLWADALTELGQFVIQGVAAFAMIAAVGIALADKGLNYATFWSALPSGHTDPTTSDYPAYFLLVYVIVKTFEYNGGMWNLAQRYIATPDARAARRTALLSSGLYLLWPVVLMLPMFAGPLLVQVSDPEDVYAEMALQFLPAGLLGLVLVGVFSHTMAMAASDATAISAVMTRDVLPKIWRRAKGFTDKQFLAAGRVLTVAFVFLSVVIAINAENLGGVLGIIVAWVGALIGPISIPMMLGMLRPFRRIGPAAALSSWAGGLITFAVTKYVLQLQEAITVVSPVLVSLALFGLVGTLHRDAPPAAEEITAALAEDERESAAQPTAP
ncbi:Na+:solute symporter [Saccharopolyspora sp. HNM0986]|uniref:sodium:solute symporter family protein n=1 Tax=Saccharopolyspora galaxeae TaxID=2781241 RepID=UPI00190DF861|nr:sodium:solute symporter family protein [Saccharopolyspora sp. HNM0986]MBK0867742.1 Na+:solute symporter [Saccharopolyspora sp. HNM0986]